MNKITGYIFAIFVTATAVLMSAVAALERGGTTVDQVLVVCLAAAICIGSHLIPSISKSKISWMLWMVCVLGAIYSHITFFTYSKLRAGEERSQHSVQKQGVERQINAIRMTLETIHSRSVATVASELSITNGWRMRSALAAELSEAKRAAALQAEMIMLISKATEVEVTGAADLVTARIARVTGSNQDSTDLVIALIYSILLEMIGAFLWCEVLKRKNDIPPENSQASSKGISPDDLENAIESGKIKATVKDIRTFLGCGQHRAMELRRRYLQKAQV